MMSKRMFALAALSASVMTAGVAIAELGRQIVDDPSGRLGSVDRHVAVIDRQGGGRQQRQGEQREERERFPRTFHRAGSFVEGG